MSKKTTLEVLRAARDVIAAPEHWTKGAVARSCQGHRVHVHGLSAFCFCTVGAIRRTMGSNYSPHPFSALSQCLPGGFKSLPDFNDHPDTTHADVLALFDKAIAKEEANG